MIDFQTKRIDEDDKHDEIRGNTIILHDDNDSSSKVLKEVLIIKPAETKHYVIKRTINGRYLFN